MPPVLIKRRLFLRASAVTAAGVASAAVLAACGGATSVAATVASGSSASAVASASAALTTAATASASQSSQATTTASAVASTTASSVASTTQSAVSTAAPTSSAAAKPATSGVTITWWSGWGSGGIAGQTFDQVAAAANQAALGFTVQHQPQSSVAKKLATVIAAGTPPDVEVGNLSYPEFWATGQATALDSYLAKSQTLKKEDLLDTSWKFGTYKGHTFGVPAAEAFVRWGTVANTDLLAKRGLDPAQLPTNWSDLLEWHKELTVVDPSTKAITQLGLDPLDAMGGSASGGDPFFWGPSFGLGTGYYDEGAEKFNLVTPQLTDALTTIKSFYDAAGGYAAVQTFRKTNDTWTGTKAGIVVGTQAIQVNGYWTPGALAKVAPTKHYTYTWAPVSADRKGTKMQSTGGHFAVLPKGSPHPDQAFAMAEFLTTEPAEKIMFDGEGFLGARKSYLQKVDAKQYPGIDFYLQSATTASELWADPVDPIEGFFSDNWQTLYTKVFQGQLTPQDALSQLQQLCTVQLAKQLGKS